MNINMKFNEGMRRSRCSRIQFTLSIENLILQKLRECLFFFLYMLIQFVLWCRMSIFSRTYTYSLSFCRHSCISNFHHINERKIMFAWEHKLSDKCYQKNNVFKDSLKGFAQLFLKHTVSLRYWDLYHNSDFLHSYFD